MSMTTAQQQRHGRRWAIPPREVHFSAKRARREERALERLYAKQREANARRVGLEPDRKILRGVAMIEERPNGALRFHPEPLEEVHELASSSWWYRTPLAVKLLLAALAGPTLAAALVYVFR